MTDTPFAEAPCGLGPVLAARGFTDLTPIQRSVLGSHLEGHDLRISSQTGSGKTVALGLVVAAEVAAAVDLESPSDHCGRPSVVLVAPTRELAVQLAEELTWLFAPLGATVVSLTGGTSIAGDLRALRRDPRVLVGTPGRIRDHLERGSLELDRVRAVALDEADEMLAMGFEEEVCEILEATPEDRRTHLVSATFPPSVEAMASRHQREPVMVTCAAPGASNADISHRAMVVGASQSLPALINVLLMEPAAKTLIFVRTRNDSTGLAEALCEHGFAARPLSGDLAQRERTATLASFKRGQTSVLVATDVAARGLDVRDIDQVIHVHLPDNAEVLTHRSGRTGRAGRKGRSLVFVPPRAVRRVEAMLRQADIRATEVPIPCAADIHRAADRRLLEGFEALDADSGDGDRRLRLAAELLSDRDPVAVVAALLAQSDHDGPCAPRDIPPARERHGHRPAPRRAGDRRDEGGDWARFQVSWGREHGADPRRLLAVVCRRGAVASRDVGAIKIGGRSSMVEIRSAQARAFAHSAAQPDPRDPRIKFREWRD